MAQICKTSCAGTAPAVDWNNACDVEPRVGGIPRMTFLLCDPDFELPYAAAEGETNKWTNLDNVKWALCNGFLFVTGDVLGSKGRGSFGKKRLKSCSPETTISGTKQVSWQDYNADNENLIDFDFYAFIEENIKYMDFGYITCDDLWYQHVGDWDGEFDTEHEDSKDGTSFHSAVVTMNAKTLIKPIKVTGLMDFLRNFKADPQCYS